MRSAGTWFLVLATVCIVAPYVLGVRPKTRRHWVYLAQTFAFSRVDPSPDDLAGFALAIEARQGRRVHCVRVDHSGVSRTI